ncbi:VanZ family protein [Chitinophaga rhizophila]|uniref:VanZ family protein n=1 Tax=Chitinophaga rhizophila TaxID=2866212 RepID=A0ABS7G7L2_9BACT|nr:VanZ family protein [Chitinophaga rhizophila]MBW8683652.1 VanZ family protein [Chitinophaga rhizophila]
MTIRLKRGTVIILLISYLLAVLYIVFLEPTRGAGEHYAPPRWMPLKSTYDFIIEAGQAVTYYRYWAFFLLNLLGNIIMFMPLGFLVDALSEGAANKIKVIAIAFFFSLSIELLQLVLMIGVYDADDVVLNTLGAYLGLVLYRRLERKRMVLVYSNT